MSSGPQAPSHQKGSAENSLWSRHSFSVCHWTSWDSWQCSGHLQNIGNTWAVKWFQYKWSLCQIYHKRLFSKRRGTQKCVLSFMCYFFSQLSVGLLDLSWENIIQNVLIKVHSPLKQGHLSIEAPDTRVWGGVLVQEDVPEIVLQGGLPGLVLPVEPLHLGQGLSTLKYLAKT